MEGNIIIDGVLASCIAFANHYLAHIAMTPIRWFPGILELIFGKRAGSSEFLNVAQHIGKWLQPYGLIYDGSKL